jgi:hypothetical protein
MTKILSPAAQQRLCKRKDVTLCAAAGSLECELCTPCQYTDEHLAAVGLEVVESRAAHWAREDECGFCFQRKDRAERERIAIDHLVALYGEKDAEAVSGLNGAIARHVAGFDDADLFSARIWTRYEWGEWMEANLPGQDGSE